MRESPPRSVRALRRGLTAVWACGGGLACSNAPAPPVATAREVRIVIDSATTLAGTLTVPVNAPDTAAPAVLLLSGSGPQDRDGARAELPGYRPWREVRDALLAAGIGVLQLDDRGTGASTGRFAGTTTEEFAHDARGATAWLRRQPGIDAARLALVGHSEGAVEALLVARADPRLAALVLLGAPSRPGREIARWQRQQLVGSDLARWPAHERPVVLAAADADADALAMRDPWLRQWFVLDPRAIARDVRAAVLLLHGDTDRQVPSAHADELAGVLRSAGASPVAVRHLSHTNHLLLRDDHGDPQGYVRLPDQRVRAEALEAIVDFLGTHLRVSRRAGGERAPRGQTTSPREKAR